MRLVQGESERGKEKCILSGVRVNHEMNLVSVQESDMNVI
jgi:hypothetical protein